MDDFTLSVGPVSFSKRSELLWGDVEIVLPYLNGDGGAGEAGTRVRGVGRDY